MLVVWRCGEGVEAVRFSVFINSFNVDTQILETRPPEEQSPIIH